MDKPEPQTRRPLLSILWIPDFSLLADSVHCRINGTVLVGGGLPFWPMGCDDCRSFFCRYGLP